MLIVVENGKLIQNQNPSYFSSLSSDRYEQLKLDQIFAPLEFYLKDNNGRILTKGNYRGAGDIVNRGGKQFVILGSGNFSYLEEYEIGDVTKESDDFYTGVLWGVYNAFLAYKKKKSKVFSYANWVPKPRQELPRSSAALEGVKYGETEFKKLFGKQKKMRENPTKMSAGDKKVRGSRSFKSPVLQARDEAIEAQIKMFQFEGSYEKLQILKRVAAEKTAQAAWLLCKEQGVPETRENVISRMQLIDMDAAEVLRGIEAAAAPPAPSFPVRRRKT